MHNRNNTCFGSMFVFQHLSQDWAEKELKTFWNFFFSRKNSKNLRRNNAGQTLKKQSQFWGTARWRNGRTEKNEERSVDRTDAQTDAESVRARRSNGVCRRSRPFATSKRRATVTSSRRDVLREFLFWPFLTLTFVKNVRVKFFNLGTCSQHFIFFISHESAQ